MTPADVPAGFRTRGHPAAVRALGRLLRAERMPHALLLSGPEGSGLSTLALDLAAALLCSAPDAADRPCRDCAACRKLEHGNHPDLHRIQPDGAGEQIRLQQVQALGSELALLPMEGRLRVAIVHRAQRLNPDAQNALLKTLEEPVGAACVVLCASDVAPLLPTILSRTARLRLGPVGPAAIGEVLRDHGLDDDATAARLARASGGRPGAALALARQPDALLALDRMRRTLLDLVGADRRTRLGSASGLLADAAAFDAALRAGPRPEAGEADAGEGRSRTGSRRRPSAAAEARRPAPAERRRAVLALLDVWRGLGRDLGLVGRGAERSVGAIDLLDELRVVAPLVAPAGLPPFLRRLDGLAAAIEAYANPELALDALLLAWPSVTARREAA